MHIWDYLLPFDIQDGGCVPNRSNGMQAARRINKKKRAQRATSNIFAMFDQNQIAEFKEVSGLFVAFRNNNLASYLQLQAFNLIDHNRDDFIDKEDLRTILNQLGKLEEWVVFFC